MAGPSCRAHFVHDRSIILERFSMTSSLSPIAYRLSRQQHAQEIMQAYLIAARLCVQSALRMDAQIGADRSHS